MLGPSAPHRRKPRSEHHALCACGATIGEHHAPLGTRSTAAIQRLALDYGDLARAQCLLPQCREVPTVESPRHERLQGSHVVRGLVAQPTVEIVHRIGKRTHALGRHIQQVPCARGRIGHTYARLIADPADAPAR